MGRADFGANMGLWECEIPDVNNRLVDTCLIGNGRISELFATHSTRAQEVILEDVPQYHSTQKVILPILAIPKAFSESHDTCIYLYQSFSMYTIVHTYYHYHQSSSYMYKYTMQDRALLLHVYFRALPNPKSSRCPPPASHDVKDVAKNMPQDTESTLDFALEILTRNDLI